MTSLGVNSSGLLNENVQTNSFDFGLEQAVSIRNRFGTALLFLEPLADAVTVMVAIFMGFYLYRWLHLGKRLDYSTHAIFYIALAMSALFVILLDRDGAYRPGSSLLKIKETERSLRVTAQSFLLAIPATFFSHYRFSRWVFVINFVCVPLFLVSQKQLLVMFGRALHSRGIGVQRVLIYGAGTSGKRVFSALARSAPKVGLKPIAIVDDNQKLAGTEVYSDSYRREESVRVHPGPVTESLLAKLGCEFLVIAIPSLNPSKFARLVRVARNSNVRVAFLPGDSTTMDYWTEEADLDGMMLRVVGRTSKSWHYEAVKRPFDAIASLLLILLFSPLLITLALLVRTSSPGPIFFRQKRVGRGGRLFDLYKFRSMYVDAPKYDYSPKGADDARITRIGRFIRKASLDELPQLFNVLKGEMSLVGPRPEMPFIVAKYDAVHRQRLQVTPGITGLWQLSADRAFLIHENIQYDLYYIRHRSFFMDFAILLHTAVFAMRGV